MALPPLAPVSSLETRLGLAAATLSGVDLARAEAALGDASALIRAEAGKDWVGPDLVTITAPDAVVTVCLHAALRPYRNPDGFSGESVGDYSYQYAATGDPVDVYLSDEEKRVVRRAALGTAGPGFSGSIRVPSAYGDFRAVDPALYFWGLE